MRFVEEKTVEARRAAKDRRRESGGDENAWKMKHASQRANEKPSSSLGGGGGGGGGMYKIDGAVMPIRSTWLLGVGSRGCCQSDRRGCDAKQTDVADATGIHMTAASRMHVAAGNRIHVAADNWIHVAAGNRIHVKAMMGVVSVVMASVLSFWNSLVEAVGMASENCSDVIAARLRESADRCLLTINLAQMMACACATWMEGQNMGHPHCCGPRPPSQSAYMMMAQDPVADSLFLRHFNMTRRTFLSVLQPIYPAISDAVARLGLPIVIDPAKVFAIAIHRWAHGDDFVSLSDKFGVQQEWLQKAVQIVTDAIIDVHVEKELVFPDNEQGWNAIEAPFREKGFPNCVGVIDCTRIGIEKPPVDPEAYCRCHQQPNADKKQENQYSIMLQAVVDLNLRFLNVYVGWPGRTHYSRVLQNSRLYMRAQQDGTLFQPYVQRVESVDVGQYLLGKFGYPLLPWLLVPFPRCDALVGDPNRFNERHSSARKCVDQAFHRLKDKWHVLHAKFNEDLKTINRQIIAICILHNLLLPFDEPSTFNALNSTAATARSQGASLRCRSKARKLDASHEPSQPAPRNNTVDGTALRTILTRHLSQLTADANAKGRT
ncbi:hypothetical protein CBR_g12303 [Chara braunii]|uniref:DDE Tnp4 domain-containing protein n=1 Tax=Chara braunii TaxID=69332 RepID=A0A388KRR8_CHABU|nr:hypothetical protein CBR_g12303 [Chara braunii]|eukprot:GBG72736.1 hypothetical protein CBR_g12303 [Chara braunii]